MVANFDTAMDARYAIAQGGLWSTVLHPFAALTDDEFLSGFTQAITVAGPTEPPTAPARCALAAATAWTNRRTPGAYTGIGSHPHRVAAGQPRACPER